MADALPTPVPSLTRANGSALDPLREPLFRSLWFAPVISHPGTWMQNVGAGWLMSQLTMSPLKIGLVQAASTLPVFLVILPAGALADMVDRRRFLLITQAWMVAAAGLLGVFTLLGYVTPWILLLFTFILGLGAVMNDPAWQALTPDIVCRENHAPAVALNSVGFNVARAVGPALGGLVIAATSSGIAFLMNAASFFGVIFFLYRWKRPSFDQAQTGRVLESMRAGFRFLPCARFSLAQSRAVRQRHRLDRHPRLPECCRADYVSTVDARTRIVYVFAGLAGRHGLRQRRLGSTGDKSWSPDYNALFRR